VPTNVTGVVVVLLVAVLLVVVVGLGVSVTGGELGTAGGLVVDDVEATKATSSLVDVAATSSADDEPELQADISNPNVARINLHRTMHGTSGRLRPPAAALHACAPLRGMSGAASPCVVRTGGTRHRSYSGNLAARA
jgi:hypothetical protein